MWSRDRSYYILEISSTVYSSKYSIYLLSGIDILIVVINKPKTWYAH